MPAPLSVAVLPLGALVRVHVYVSAPAPPLVVALAMMAFPTSPVGGLKVIDVTVGAATARMLTVAGADDTPFESVTVTDTT